MKLDTIIRGDCIDSLRALPAEAVDLVFADPPYNLQLSKELFRTGSGSKVNGCTNDWDRFADFQAYDEFTAAWLGECRRILKPDGAVWVIGSFHNIFRVGTILQNLGFWIQNDVVWLKTNPMPNFLGKRLANAHETLIWAGRGRESKCVFNYDALKVFNDDKQLRSDWTLPVCAGRERLRDAAGAKVHPTQKPLELLHRILLASTNPGGVVLDPFFGTGTTGAAAKLLGRRWIGLEREPAYIAAAEARINAIEPLGDAALQVHRRKREVRIPFGDLVAAGRIVPGAMLTDRAGAVQALVRADGSLELDGETGSIHAMGAAAQGTDKCNGWTYWHTETAGGRIPIDEMRREARAALLEPGA